jgi:outer membrane murein-binding lipoprotein Lpp
VPIAERLADVVEEKTLHMVNADPKRTPSFTMFGNPDFYWQTSTPSCGATICVNPSFAWNHGDVQEEIGTTWLGMVGPGVDAGGVDSTTWSDHPDIRPTINALVGLSDSYQDDGRVITELIDKRALGKSLDSKDTTDLGASYKQVNAPFGVFALDTLTASTAALNTADELKYESIESQIANLTTERDQLAGNIRTALNDAAAGKSKIDNTQARDWITQAQSLLDRAHALALANPA